ncbi:MAG: hypothetical protein ACRYGC_10335 [Janthinobacterium lividum]
MKRPLAPSAAGWFLVVSGVLPALLLLRPDAPPDPRLAALFATIPPDGRFWDAMWWADLAITAAAGVLVLRGRRAGRVLCLSSGAVWLALSAWRLMAPSGLAPAVERQAWFLAVVFVLIDLAIYLSVAFLLFRQTSRDWFALPPAGRSFGAWSLRGVFGAVLLAAGGFLLYCWLFVCLLFAAMALGHQSTGLMVMVLAICLVPVAALLSLGLVVAPGRRGRRRLALVGLCSGLFTLFVGVMCGTALCSPLLLSLLPSAQVPEGFGPRLLLACPLLLALLIPCGLHLRRPAAAPG